MIHFGN
nr:Chain A, Major prion protein [Mus musculus]